MKPVLTISTFSKTRIVYYVNRNNTITANNVKDLKSSTEYTQPANNQHKIVTIPGSKTVALSANDLHHGWHSIPLNRYGLYLTMAEMQPLFENFDQFWPVNLKVATGHAVPLAKHPATTNTTQLSFNSTIYSLMYDLLDGDFVAAKADFDTIDNAYDFYRSFDGGSWSNANKRVLPPSPDILYKIPYAATDPTQKATNDEPTIGIIDNKYSSNKCRNKNIFTTTNRK